MSLIHARMLADVTARVDSIIADSNDPERQHSDEDQLLNDVLEQYAPHDILAELNRLAAANFPRWCA